MEVRAPSVAIGGTGSIFTQETCEPGATRPAEIARNVKTGRMCGVRGAKNGCEFIRRCLLPCTSTIYYLDSRHGGVGHQTHFSEVLKRMSSVMEMDFIEELRLRRWARENYVPPEKRERNWHPVVHEEMKNKDSEKKNNSNPDRA